jgi:16S rRNA (cytosine1402-N4)-methyltransferase
VHSHQPVLLAEALASLAVARDACYVDCTFGRGGHAAAVLDALGPDGRLVALDRDPAAIAAARARFGGDPRFTIHHAPFSSLARILEGEGLMGRVAGILLDLGVSSPQLDDPARGFSFQAEGPLDMRMDPTSGESAAQFVARASERELEQTIRELGEDRFAKRIAHAIVAARAAAPIADTARLAAVVAAAVPTREPGKHPATRTFQALRLRVNRELDELSAVLPQCVAALAPRGRLAVISFHSLEDRAVKRFMRNAAQPHAALDPRLPPPPDLPAATLRVVGKAQTAGEAELAANPRARSAVLRVAERLA